MALLWTNYWPMYLNGIKKTLILALAATAIGCVIGLICGIPLIVEFGSTGLVPRIPTAILTIAFMMLSALSLVCGLILDTVVKGNRKEYELRVIDAYQKYTHSQI